MASFSISGTLEKMANRDKDFRFMASSDLLTELGKDTFKLDADSEKRLTQMLLKLLEDRSGDVQGMAVKCIGPLIKKVNESQVGEIVDQTANLLLKDKNDDVRDIASLGLQLAIENCNQKDGAHVVKRLSGRLIAAIAAETKEPEKKDSKSKSKEPTPAGPSDAVRLETKLECMQRLEDLLARFGSLMTADFEKIQSAVLPQLTAQRAAARKRAIGCLSRLAAATPDKTFTVLIEHLLKSATESKKSDHVRTFVQTIGAISVAVGYRLGKYLNQIVPLVAKHCKEAGTEDESDEELRENCLQTFEALVLRCPKEISAHLPTIISIALEYIKHDPNYAEGDAEDMETDGGDEEEEDADGEYSADDDVSWKVRRASCKVLNAVINTRPELMQLFYDKVAPVLIARFKEREESVKGDIFVAFVSLLKQTNVVSRKSSGIAGSKAAAASLLADKVNSIVSNITKQLKQKSIKTRVGAFALLKELVAVLNGGLQAHLKDIVPGIIFSLGDKSTNSNLKIETLTFLRALLANHTEAAFHPHIKALVPPVLKAVADGYYKIAAEALRVTTEVVRVLRTPGSADAAKFEFKPFVKPIYDATYARLKATDTDQEVKDTAINAMGLIVANLGDELSGDLKDALSILQDRLANEITRLTTVKVFARIASSPLHLNLSSVLPDATKDLATFLRKQNRQLKQSSLTTLEIIVKNYGKEKAIQAHYPAVLGELTPLVSDTDLHISHLSLILVAAILKASPETISVVREGIYTKSLELVQSSLLQGSALSSILALFSELVTIGDKKLTYEALLESFLGLTKKQLPKQCYSSIAQCIAAVTAATDAGKRDGTVQRFVKDVQKTNEEPVQHIALLCLGEIGRRMNLEKTDNIQKVVFAAFESPSEEVKSAASFALGSIAVGNLAKFLPFILAEVKNQPKRQYLLLQSLREVISRTSQQESGKELQPQLGNIMPLLFENTESEEEGTRNVVAECLGKLAFVNPEKLLPEIQSRLTATSPRARSTLVAALKFTIVDQPAAIDPIILPLMGSFLDLLKDAQLDVRRASLLTLNWATHNKPALIRDLLPKYMPAVLSEAKLKPELIREVDLGPFKHKVDDGLENRKAAYETMNTVLDTCHDKVELAPFISQLVEGLKDPSYDIKMLAHLMVIRLAAVAGAAMLESLDLLVEPLRTTVTFKPPQTAVKQDVDRNDELVRSALRSVVAIARIDNVESNMKFEEFLRTTVKTGELAEKFETIRIAENADNGDPMDTN